MIMTSPDQNALTFDKQESFLRGYIPLKIIKDKYTKDGKAKTEIDFSKNAYCTDAVLKTLSTLPQSTLKGVTRINLSGCCYLTDNSAIWLSKILKATDCFMPTVITDGCRNLTDCFFSTILEAKQLSLSLKATSTTYLPDIGNTIGCASLTGVSEQSTVSGDSKQWVKKVASYSSQYNSTTWAAKTVEGPPQVYPKYGDIHGAWAQGSCDSKQWIVLQYAEPVYVTDINIYETYHCGSVKRVSVYTPQNELHKVYEVPRVQNIQQSRILNVPVEPLSFKVSQIKIEQDCTASGSWCEIDAVELVGRHTLKGKTFSGIQTESKQSHLLILPQKSITSSIGAMLLSRKAEKKSINHWENWNEIPEWNVNVTEISPDNPFFSHIVPTNPTQAVICYDTQAPLEVSKKYVVDTLTRMLFRVNKTIQIWMSLEPAESAGSIDTHICMVLLRKFEDILVCGSLIQEKTNPKHSLTKPVAINSAESLSLVANGNFINPVHIANMSFKDGVLRNLSTSENVMGLCHCEMPFTRSNCYFEVEVVEVDQAVKEIACLIGCLHDILYTDRDPMGSRETHGGEVEGFELKAVGSRYGFGIEGEWLSEYVPSDNAKFYFTENGKKTDKVTENPPCSGVYPCVSVLGKGVGALKLNKHVPVPGEFFEPHFAHLSQYTSDGVVTYRDDYLHSGDVGLLIIGPEPVSKTNNTCTIEILDKGQYGAISFGIGPENYPLNRQVGWEKNSIALHGDDGNQGHIMSVTGFTSGGAGVPRLERTIEHLPVTQHHTCSKCTPLAGLERLRTCASWNAVRLTTQCDHAHTPAMGMKNKYTVHARLFKETGSGSSFSQAWKVGDKIKVCADPREGNGSSVTYNVTFFINEKKLNSSPMALNYKEPKGVRCMFMVGTHSKRERYKVLNMRNKNIIPAAISSSLTLGRCHFMNVFDDGTIKYRKFFDKTCFGTFLSKTRLNKSMMSFEVEVLTVSSQKHIGIGLAHWNYPRDKMVGWLPGSIGCHADNGMVYQEYSSGTGNGSPFGAKDVITCGIKEVQFGDDGEIAPGQTVTVYFKKNGKLVHEFKQPYWSNGLHPCVNLHFEGDSVKLKNFYPETQTRIDKAVLAIQEAKKAKEEKESGIKKVSIDEMVNGCQFTVVGVNNGSSGKSDQIEKKLDLSKDLPLAAIKTRITEMENNLEKLDLQGQENYAELCAGLEKITKFTSAKDRIEFLSIDVKSGKGHSELKKRLTTCLDVEAEGHPSYYVFPESVIKEFNKALDIVKAGRMITVGDLASSDKMDIFKNEGAFCYQTLKHLHNQGHIVFLSELSTPVAMDMDFVISIVEKYRSSPADTARQLAPAVDPSTMVWNWEKFESLFTSFHMNGQNRSLLKEILMKYMGVISFPCLRVKPDDEKYIFTLQPFLKQADLDRYMGQKSVKSKANNYIVMTRTYNFLYTLPKLVISMVLANCAKYGRVLVCGQNGIVLQNGGVQTCLQHVVENGTNLMKLMSNCYYPDQFDEDMNQKLDVEEYTWNVFCIFSDSIDYVLKQQKVVAIIHQNTPSGRVNKSLGCVHIWDVCDVIPNQSVCTLCNKCCELGGECDYTGIIGEYIGHCECGTHYTGCKDCGICRQCAEELWHVRSYLRPCLLTSNKDKTKFHQQIALIPETFGEVEITNTGGGSIPICLRLLENPNGAVIQALPGPAVQLPDAIKLNDYNQSNKFNREFCNETGDTLKIKLKHFTTNPELLKDTETESATIPVSRPVYYTAICREAKVWHETGVVCYETTSASIPVGQFIGARPLSRDCDSFSYRIVNEGRGRYISIGLCPRRYQADRQPGWNTGSIGYHADDGGVFSGAGYATVHKEAYNKGDIIKCKIDFESNRIIFSKNDTVVYTSSQSKRNIESGTLHPAVGFHSLGEAVQLLDKDAWLPEEGMEMESLPMAFDCKKYGNLWISPGQKINMTKFRTDAQGWLNLYNPSDGPIAVKLKQEGGVNKLVKLERKEVDMNRVIWAAGRGSTVQIQWFALETGRRYNQDQLNTAFDEMPDERKLRHEVTIIKSDVDEFAEQLPKVTSEPPTNNNVFILQIYKNMQLLAKYWLPKNRYVCFVPEFVNSDYILTSQKFPTFNHSSDFERGMLIKAKVPSTSAFHECRFITNGAKGNMFVEYSIPDSEYNVVEELSASCLDYKAVDIAEGNFISYQPKDAVTLNRKSQKANDIVKVRRAAITAPSFLLPEVVRQAEFSAVKPDKDKVDGSSNVESPNSDLELSLFLALSDCSSCLRVMTNVTVQEYQMIENCRQLDHWYRTLKENGLENHIYTVLPHKITADLAYRPVYSDLFEKTEVHKLCFMRDQVIHFADNYNMKLKVPVHFIDQKGSRDSEEETAAQLKFQPLWVWAYAALTGYRMLLPSYEQLFPELKHLKRMEVETLIHWLLRTYSSLGHIYTEHIGNPVNMAFWQHLSHLPAFDAPTEGLSYRKYTQDSHLMIKRGKYSVCKAHFVSLEGLQETTGESTKFSYDYFDPYIDTVNAFNWTDTEVDSLPSNFFRKFSNLECFKIQAKNLKQLPTGLSDCKKLKYVYIEGMPMEDLPQDLMKSESIEEIMCSNLLIRDLPAQWTPTLNLTRLSLKDSLIEELPDAVCHLQKLVSLDLSGNLLTALPVTFGKLTSLKILLLSGLPWFTEDIGHFEISKEKYFEWFEIGNKHILQFLTKPVVEKLFVDCDVNKNRQLDREETGRLNVELFFRIPRIGCDDINDPNYGGVPPQVFELPSLTTLDLSYQGITFIPEAIAKMQNLEHLILAHCPLLEGLPGLLGHLPTIKSIVLNHCPSLRTPPNEVVCRGINSVKAYLKRLAGGFTECRRTKLMLVGLGGAGKTSLLQALMSSNKKTQGTEGELITDGIDIQAWTVKNSDGTDITFSTWDFAGQSLYYNTHQFFLSKRAIYFLLWSCRQGFEHAGLDFWLSSITCHAPKTPIFIIGTHFDQVPKAELPMTELKKRYPDIRGFHFVSSIEGIGIEKLEKQLMEVTLEQKYMNEKIPQVWLNLEKKILIERNKDISILPWQAITDFGMDIGIYDEKDIKEAVQFLHNLGTVQYFDNDFLRDQIVINPQWIVNVMACVVSVKQSPIQAKNGRFHHEDMAKVWSEYGTDLYKWLMQLTEEFDLTFPLPKENINLVPCLLSQEAPEELKWPPPDISEREDVTEARIIYQFSYLPAGLFNRAQVRLFQFSDGKHIWKRGSLLNKNNHVALIQQNRDSELTVNVVGPRPYNVLFLIHEVFEGLIDESFYGIKEEFNNFLVPCPDCVMKAKTLDPCMFDADLVRRAQKHKTPFIQCRKYFHTVSMGQMLETMPENTTDNFDANLQRSIAALQELNSSMGKDVAILYCSANIPKSSEKNKIHPVQIRDYLESKGFSSWFDFDIQKCDIQTLTLAMKNCKVVVALLSDLFEKDQCCHDMLLHAMDILNKPYVIVVLDETTNWQSTDLGMRIGKHEFLVMLRSQERFPNRIDDLFKQVETKAAVEQGKVTHPVCFISYAWSNSHTAISLGSRSKPGSLGWEGGDPRKVKDFLVKNGISCWLDKEQLGRKGMLEDISEGLVNAKVLVACVSNQYIESDACLMEYRFGVLDLELPLILCVVGTGSEWKQSEVAMIARRVGANKVYLQQENEAGLTTLLQFIKQALPSDLDKVLKKDKVREQRKQLKEKAKATQAADSLSYQEEYELIQRKFMRHVISYVSNSDTYPMPRLIIFDFYRDVGKRGERSRQRGLSDSRPRTANKRSSRETIKAMLDEPQTDEESSDWKSEIICLKVSCEHEEGWHLCEKTKIIGEAENLMDLLKQCTPYLARIYSILKQSSTPLACLNGKKGMAFQEWIKSTIDSLQESSETEKVDFMEAYRGFRAYLAERMDDIEEVLSQLDRCHLPSGKITWLCQKHQEGPRITKMSLDVGGGQNPAQLLSPADMVFKEYMERSDIYKKKKAVPSKKKPEKIIKAKPPPTEIRAVNTSNKTDKTKKPTEKTKGETGTSVKTKPTPESQKFKAAGHVVETANAGRKLTREGSKTFPSQQKDHLQKQETKKPAVTPLKQFNNPGINAQMTMNSSPKSTRKSLSPIKNNKTDVKKASPMTEGTNSFESEKKKQGSKACIIQ